VKGRTEIEGKNKLGHILNEIRHSVSEGFEFEDWLRSRVIFKLVENQKYMPTIRIEVSKNGEVLEEIVLERRAYFIFGVHPDKCSVVLQHPSLSRCHAAIVVDENEGVLIVDLGSQA
jgi:hypothetical protein